MKPKIKACLCNISTAGLYFGFAGRAIRLFFDFTRGVFSHAGYEPVFLKEPAEHDVLLARIAAGEGMGLMPASFSAIRREGVQFVKIMEEALLCIQLGLIAAPDTSDIVEEVLQDISLFQPCHS